MIMILDDSLKPLRWTGHHCDCLLGEVFAGSGRRAVVLYRSLLGIGECDMGSMCIRVNIGSCAAFVVQLWMSSCFFR